MIAMDCLTSPRPPTRTFMERNILRLIENIVIRGFVTLSCLVLILHFCSPSEASRS